MRPPHVHSALAISAALIAGCTGYLHEPYRLGDKSPVVDERFDLYFVEADDEGWLWQADKQPGAECGRTPPSHVIRSWFCSSRLAPLRAVLRRQRGVVQRNAEAPAHRPHQAGLSTGEQREHTTSAADDSFKLIGIYLGWRGRSLPGRSTISRSGVARARPSASAKPMRASSSPVSIGSTSITRSATAATISSASSAWDTASVRRC